MIVIGAEGYAAGVYSQALFELASQEQSLDSVKKDLDILSNLIKEQKDFLSFMTSPNFTVEQKRNLFEKISPGFDSLTVNFLKTVLAHNRISLLPFIIEKYEKMYRGSQNLFDVQITFAKPVGTDELQLVKNEIKTAMGGKDINLSVKIDSSILGGTIIRYEDKVIDNSIRNRLRQALETTISRSRNRGKIYET